MGDPRILKYPDVTSCQSATLEECREKKGYAFQQELHGDLNWIGGCFEWYEPEPSKRLEQGEHSHKTYYNHRPGAHTGVVGGDRVCTGKVLGAHCLESIAFDSCHRSC